jgi:hypothetical protein
MKLAERGTRLSNGLWVRQVRKLSAGGKQTAILTLAYGKRCCAPLTLVSHASAEFGFAAAAVPDQSSW